MSVINIAELWCMWYLWCMHCEGCGFCLPTLECPACGKAHPNPNKWVFQKWCEEVDVDEVLIANRLDT